MTVGSPARDVVTLAPGSVHLLGANVRFDDRVSWCPPGVAGYQSSNAYLLTEGDTALLVDSGFAVVGDSVLGQLAQVRRPGSALPIFITRVEYDCFGNAMPVCLRYDVPAVYARNDLAMFARYDAPQRYGRAGATWPVVAACKDGDAVPVGPGRSLTVIEAPLRLLTGLWAYDAASRTLFTSDIFGYTWTDAPDGPRVLDRADATPGVEEVRMRLEVSRLWFAHSSKPGVLAAKVKRAFGTWDVETIAPSYGCVLTGRPVVERCVDTLIKALG